MCLFLGHKPCDILNSLHLSLADLLTHKYLNPDSVDERDGVCDRHTN